MQPLRASLDFLPMRLSVFHIRGNPLFPSACIDLEHRRDTLEEQWKKLDSDAESLRKELGEDRWVLVFRNAGRQAVKMFESIERGQDKLTEVATNGMHATDPASFARAVESYEAKKRHYVPAVERVLAIIDRGVLDRLTVNGEILRLQSDLKRRWTALHTTVHEIERMVEAVKSHKPPEQLRDSISTIASTEKSWTSSGLDSPRSSPASSVILGGRKSSVGSKTPTTAGYSAQTHRSRVAELPRRTIAAKSSFTRAPTNRSISSPVPHVTGPYVPARTPYFREFKDPINKPRWSSSANTNNTPLRVPRDFPPLSATEPSPYRKMVPSPRKYTPGTQTPQFSHIPLPESAQRTMSPTPGTITPISNRKTSRMALPPRASTALGTRRVTIGSSLPNQNSRVPPLPSQRSPQASPSVTTPSTARRQSNRPTPSVNDASGANNETRASTLRPSSQMSFSKTSRPASALSSATRGDTGLPTTTGPPNPGKTPVASGRRRSSIQTPQGVWSRANGRDSRQGTRGAGEGDSNGKSHRWVY